jgi:hypothetical protein
MAPYISDSERRAASRMTWSSIVAHVRATEQCDESEARRRIGNAIHDGKLLARWADKPVIPPMPGSKVPFVPKDTSSALMPDDAPPRDATYWMECESQATDPDSVLEPPPYDPGMVNKRTAQRLDKRRRFRKPLFKRESVLYLWPSVKAATSSEAEARDNAVGSDTSDATNVLPFTSRKTGPKTEKLRSVINAMKDDIGAGRLSPDALRAMADKELLSKYGDRFGAKRATCREARERLLPEFDGVNPVK